MYMSRRQKLYTILTSIFVTALILAEITGSKLIQSRITEDFVFTMTMGVIPFPITFLVTDIVNEYYGKPGIRFVTFLGMFMIAFTFAILLIDMSIPAASFSPVTDDAFNSVFGQSNRIILGSITAYLVGQFIDVQVFHYIRKRTHEKMLWLRATGSTFVSQLIDSFVVLFIAFSGKIPYEQILNIGITNYIYKFFIAVALTPLIYLAHHFIDRYLGDEAHAMIHQAEELK
ncbi:queuosine precursor transporter [bacterium]|nr:queuosine precursor transporter [bacterium]